MMSALTPFPDTLSKDETYQRLIDAFRLWCDDMAIWRGETYGLYNEDDPYPEVRSRGLTAPSMSLRLRIRRGPLAFARTAPERSL